MTSNSLIDLKKLKIVLLDCFYELSEDRRAQELFSKVIHLKISGYRKEYPYGVLPVDAGDYIGTHLLLCEEGKDGLNPIMGFKSVLMSRCKTFQIPFPALSLLSAQLSPSYGNAIRSVLNHAEKSNEDIAYNGSWTIAPEVRNNRELRNLCKEITTFLLVRYYDFYKIPHVFAGAAVRFKSDKIQEFVGFEYLKNEDGIELEPMECRSFFNEKVALMHLKEITSASKLWAEQFDHLWKDRLVLAVTKDEELRKAA